MKERTEVSTKPQTPPAGGKLGRSRLLGLLCSALWLGAGIAAAENVASTPWQRVKTPAPGEPRSIGDYSAGCVQGAQPLPLDGEGYHVMHPSRLRYFGHPSLIDFIEKLAQGVHADGLGVLLIGDLSQPRGGRAPGGHASHQTGLDVDIWYWHPKSAEQGPLSDAQREQLHARSVLDGKNGGIRSQWASPVATMLKLTAEDPRVERVFVHPIIKRALCALPDKDKQWLHKLRPWFGHDDHFHVRLACPSDSPDCKVQAPAPKGDGCDELDWWFSEEAQADRKKGQRRYQGKVARAPKLPEQCRALISAD